MRRNWWLWQWTEERQRGAIFPSDQNLIYKETWTRWWRCPSALLPSGCSPAAGASWQHNHPSQAQTLGAFPNLPCSLLCFVPQPSRVLSCQPPWQFPKKTLCSSLDNLLTLQKHKLCLYRTNTSSQIAAASKMLCAYTENSLALENKAGSPQDQPGTVHITVPCSHYIRLYNCHSRREMVSVSPVRDENVHEQGGILMNHIKPTF